MSAKRENFGSNIAAVSAMAGSAIGLGNIWRFPYIVGQNGGAAFILIYVFCVIFLSLPIMVSETVIGRSSRSNTFGAMDKLAPGTKWKWLAVMTLIAPMIILSYYSVVGGWSVSFLARSVVTGFSDGAEGIFGQFISSTWGPLACHTVFIGLTCLIILGGVTKGIERFNKISLPVLFVLIVSITVYSLSLPGAEKGVSYLLKPDWSLINGRSFACAMGQSFFSLSLGVGTILTYSSYMKKEDSLVKSAFGTSCFDLVFAVIAGFAIMPAIFSAGIEPGTGPGLVFESLPFIFAKMGEAAPVISRVASIVFFLTIIIAALTSSISLCEVGVAYLVEEKGLSRKKAVLGVFALTWVVGILCSLSFGPMKGVLVAGQNIFSFCDSLSSNFLMPAGALLYAVFVGWKMSKEKVREEINSPVFNVMYFTIKWIAPVVIALIFITNFML